MTLSEYLQNSPRGTLGKIAKLINSHAPDISRWASGDRPVPPHKALAIEMATEGEVSRKELLPNDWQCFWPDLSKERESV